MSLGIGTHEVEHQSLRIDVNSIAALAVPFGLSTVAFLTAADSSWVLILLAGVGLTVCVFETLRVNRRLASFGVLGLLVFDVAMLFWFYLPAFLTAFTQDQWNNKAAAAISINNGDAVEAFMMIALFHLAFTLGYQWRPGPRAKRFSLKLLGDGIEIRTQTAAALAVASTLVALTFYVTQAGGVRQAIDFVLSSRSGVKPWSSNGNFGTSVTPFAYIAQGLLVCSAIVSLVLVILGKLRGLQRWVSLMVGVVALAWVSLDTGTRSTLLLGAIPPILVYFARLKMSWRPDRAFRYFGITLVLALVVLAANFQHDYRYSGQASGSVDLKVEDNDFFTFTAYALAVQQREGRYTGENVLVNLATGPIPRTLWHNKPFIQSVVVFSRYVWGRDVTLTGGNTLPSIVGQQYLSDGPPGVAAMGLVVGLLLALGDSVFRRAAVAPQATYGIFLMFVFVSFRTMSFGFFIPFEVMVMACAVARLFGASRKERRSPIPELPSTGRV